MCAKGRNKKTKVSAEKNHGSETLFPEEEVERMEREDDDGHLIMQKGGSVDVLLASISSSLFQRLASYFLMLVFVSAFFIMLYEHFHGKEIELPVFWGMTAMAVFCLTWFYCSLTGSTKVYSDRITFRGYRYLFFPCKGTISLNDIESVCLSWSKGKGGRVYEIETTVVESSGKKIEWKIPTSDVGGMYDTIVRAMLASTTMYQRQNSPSAERKFILQRVSDQYASVVFHKQDETTIPFTQWPKAEPFSMKLGEVLCAMNQDNNEAYFFKMLDLSNVCSLVNKHFPESVRMGQAGGPPIFTKGEANRIVKEEKETEIRGWLYFGALVLLLLFLISVVTC